mmetsp:Transcript_70182/g.196695  ORF Transcript_70182/g.196695 Transcript_70182/m.196695 type:complete len:230 (-) Transcript_70182:333-1022(-)
MVEVLLRVFAVRALAAKIFGDGGHAEPPPVAPLGGGLVEDLVACVEGRRQRLAVRTPRCIVTTRRPGVARLGLHAVGRGALVEIVGHRHVRDVDAGGILQHAAGALPAQQDDDVLRFSDNPQAHGDAFRQLEVGRLRHEHPVVPGCGDLPPVRRLAVPLWEDASNAQIAGQVDGHEVGTPMPLQHVRDPHLVIFGELLPRTLLRVGHEEVLGRKGRTLVLDGLQQAAAD